MRARIRDALQGRKARQHPNCSPAPSQARNTILSAGNLSSVSEMDLVTEFRWIIAYQYDYVVQEAIELANKVQMSEKPTEVNKKFVAYRDRYNNFIYDFNKFLRLLDEKLKITVSELKTIDKDVEFYGPEKRAS